MKAKVVSPPKPAKGCPPDEPRGTPTNKVLVLQGLLYTIIAMLTPVAPVLASNQPLGIRNLSAMMVGSLIAGATALKAFLSTTFSDSSPGQGETKKS